VSRAGGIESEILERFLNGLGFKSTGEMTCAECFLSLVIVRWRLMDIVLIWQVVGSIITRRREIVQRV